MRRYFSILLAAAIVVMEFAGCAKKEPDPVPIAPILKDIVMPAESSSIPGTQARILGRGFDVSDVLTCRSLSGEKDFTPEIVAVDDYSITILLPVDACGQYEVSVTRSGLTTVLSEKLYVAYVVLLEDIVIPSGIVAQGSEIEISAKGLAEGDEVVFESEAYPMEGGIRVTTTFADGKLKLTIPNTVYGVNSLKIVRGKSIGKLGTLNVSVELFAKTAGGMVFYVSDSGVHGLVVCAEDPYHLGDAAMNWGPSIPAAFAAGSSDAIYSGKSNSAGLLTQVANTKGEYTYSHKTPVELCDEFSCVQDGITYDDWFLPSSGELIELFKVKATLSSKGVSIPANNYWTSTEFDYSGGWVWAMYYVNFYETENIVCTGCDRVAWAIGTIAIRQF